MINGTPETYLSFDYLPKHSRRIIVFGYGAGRINPESPGIYEVRVFFAEPDINDPNLKRFDSAKTFRLYVPLTDFRFFGIGNVFKNQRHVGYNREGNRYEARSISNYCISELYFEGGRSNLINQYSFHENHAPYSLRDPYITLIQKGPPIYVPPMESIRFFLSSFGHFSAKYMANLGTTSNPLDVCFSDNTGWVGNETFQIAPKGEYCDIASAVQIAILLTNMDLVQLAKALGDLCEAMRASKSTVTALYPFPENSKNIKFVALDQITYIEGRPVTESLICRRILSDDRRMPFERLNIILPDRYDSNNEDDTAKTDEPLKRNYGALKSISVTKGEVNKKYGNHVWGNLPSLIESFPHLQDVKLSITRKKKTSEIRTNPSGTHTAHNISVGSSPSSGPFITPAITFKPPLYSRQLFGGQKYEPGVMRELFNRVLQSIPKARSLGDIASDISGKSFERFQTLFEALNNSTTESGSIISRFMPRHFIVECPKSWGGWACKGNERGRYMAGVELACDGIYHYVLELELLKDHEATALGIVTEKKGRILGLHDLGCILSHCQARVRLRGNNRKPSESYIGVWPDETEYYDVIGDKLNHTKKLRHPYFFAEEIERVLGRHRIIQAQ